MRDEDWFILRTAGRSTLHLARTLNEDGFEAWTPVEHRKIGKRDVTLPILPSYVFARVSHLIDLLGIIDRKKRLASRHVEFGFMRGPDHRILATADEHLQALRVLEQKRQPRRRALKLPSGMSVRVKQEGGSFAGMVGKVVRSGEHLTLALMDGRMKVELPTFMFVENGVRSEQAVISRAA